MKTVCIYHSQDLDGWMSAAIVKHWFIANGIKNLLNINIENPNTLDFIGYHYGDPIPDLSEYDKVIMCDISFPPEKMQAIADDFTGDNFIWCDHHISAIKDNDELSYVKGIRDINFAACELTWKYFFPNESTPEIVRLLDYFGYKNTDGEPKILGLQYTLKEFITNYNDAYNLLMEELTGKFSSIVNKLKNCK